MTYALFDDAGKFHAGRVMSESDASMQIELGVGQARQGQGSECAAQVRSSRLPDELMSAGTAPSLPRSTLTWPGSSPPKGSSVLPNWRASTSTPRPASRQQAGRAAAACLMRRTTSAAPAKASSRRRRKRTVKAALLAIERKKRQVGAADRPPGPHALAAGDCPAPVREQLYKILFKPDKNAPGVQALLSKPRSASQRAPLDLLQAAGAITSAYQFHWQRFPVRAVSRRVTGFAAGLGVPVIKRNPAALPRCRRSRSTIRATTEIDDALSVQRPGHAAPS